MLQEEVGVHHKDHIVHGEHLKDHITLGGLNLEDGTHGDPKLEDGTHGDPKLEDGTHGDVNLEEIAGTHGTEDQVINPSAHHHHFLTGINGEQFKML